MGIKEYTGKKVLITGGLGMIGSSLAHKLVKYGANVTIVDACIEPYGANFFNLEGIKVTVNISDIRDKSSMKVMVRDCDIVFNLAAQVSHNDSMTDPFLDAEINYLGHLNVLECLRLYNSDALVVYSGSRLQYGKTKSMPVDETCPLFPRTPYALNKTAAENMYKYYYAVHGIKNILFRIANPYGPRSQMKHCKYSIINWFIRQAMEGETIKIFGNGLQIRDYIFIDDLVNAFIDAAITPDCIGKVFNMGSGVGTKFKDMVETVIQSVGNGRLEFIPWPEDYINIETGDYVADIKKICDVIDWKPLVTLEEGIAETYQYYKKYMHHYH